MRNQPLGRRPGFLFGFTDNDMQPDAVGEATATLLRPLTNHRQFFRYLFNRLTPRQISVDLIRRNVDSGIRRATKIERWAIFLHRRKEDLSAFHADMLARKIDLLAFQQAGVDLKKLSGHLIALFMTQKDAVTFVLNRIAARDHVNQ